MKSLEAKYREDSAQDLLPRDHAAFLWKLKHDGVNPRVIYDVGANLLHWTHVAQRVWPDATIVLFDGFPKTEFLYAESGHPYHVGVLSDMDGRVVRFYESDAWPGGNSYYCETTRAFSEQRFTERTASTLDSVVETHGFPLPDLVKMDIQGAELDVLRGGLHALSSAQHLIVEMQHTEFNAGAPRVEQAQPLIEAMGWRCAAPRFSVNRADADYYFTRG